MGVIGRVVNKVDEAIMRGSIKAYKIKRRIGKIPAVKAWRMKRLAKLDPMDTVKLPKGKTTQYGAFHHLHDIKHKYPLGTRTASRLLGKLTHRIGGRPLSGKVRRTITKTEQKLGKVLGAPEIRRDMYGEVAELRGGGAKRGQGGDRNLIKRTARAYRTQQRWVGAAEVGTVALATGTGIHLAKRKRTQKVK